MRRITIAVVLAAAALFGTLAAPSAQAQVNVAGLKPFTQQANYMSLAGFLRWRTFADTGRWISREEAQQRVDAQGG